MVYSSCSAQNKPHNSHCQSDLDKGYTGGWQNDRVEDISNAFSCKTRKSQLIAKEQSRKNTGICKNWYPASKHKTEVAMRQSQSPEPHIRIPSLEFCQQEKETPERIWLWWFSEGDHEFHETGRRKNCTIGEENKTLWVSGHMGKNQWPHKRLYHTYLLVLEGSAVGRRWLSLTAMTKTW